MRLAMFEDEAGQPRFGIELETGLLDVARAAPDLPADLQAFIVGGTSLDVLRALVADPPADALVSGPVRRLPPILRPSKILCIGINYRDHASEMNSAVPANPEVFAKFPTTLVGDGAVIFIPPESEQLDYEAELAMVIGKRACQIRAEDALDFVFGYMPFNDVTVRDVQLRALQWTLGKNYDGHGPCGPALVTADEIPDPQQLGIRLRVGDELLQDASTADMIFGCASLIEILSSVMTLEPGDVITTGTPSGVGISRTPPRWLRDGETVTVEIDRLGSLANPVHQRPHR